MVYIGGGTLDVSIMEIKEGNFTVLVNIFILLYISSYICVNICYVGSRRK